MDWPYEEEKNGQRGCYCRGEDARALYCMASVVETIPESQERGGCADEVRVMEVSVNEPNKGDMPSGVMDVDGSGAD